MVRGGKFSLPSTRLKGFSFFCLCTTLGLRKVTFRPLSEEKLQEAAKIRFKKTQSLLLANLFFPSQFVAAVPIAIFIFGSSQNKIQRLTCGSTNKEVFFLSPFIFECVVIRAEIASDLRNQQKSFPAFLTL